MEQKRKSAGAREYRNIVPSFTRPFLGLFFALSPMSSIGIASVSDSGSGEPLLFDSEFIVLLLVLAIVLFLRRSITPLLFCYDL